MTQLCFVSLAKSSHYAQFYQCNHPDLLRDTKAEEGRQISDFRKLRTSDSRYQTDNILRFVVANYINSVEALFSKPEGFRWWNQINRGTQRFVSVEYLGPVHTYPDIFESANFSFRIRLPSTRIRRIRQRIRIFLNPHSKAEK